MEEKSEMQNKVCFVTEDELNKKGLLIEVDARSIGANLIEEDGFWSIQKGKSDEQNNHPNLGSESNAENPIEEEMAEEHGSNQKGSSEKQSNGVLIEGLNKMLLGTNGIIDRGGGGGGGGDDQSIQQGSEKNKTPNSIYLLKRVPSFPGGKEIIPLLYMPPSQSDKEKNTGLNPNYHTLLDFSKSQFGYYSRIYLPELEPGCRICGFSKRWMAITKDINIHLLNPFTRELIKLPNRSELPVIPQNQQQRFTIHYNGPYYIRKVAIIDSGSNMVVGALDASGMIFLTSRTDDHWTILLSNIGFFEDIITWQEESFLGLKENGDVINLTTATLFSHVQLPNWPSDHTSSSRCYLAECTDGGLLVVSRLVLKKYDDQGASFYTTLDFQVFKLQAGEWVRTYKLWNNLIFIGLSESRVYEVDHVNDTHGYNRIYFSDDHFYKYYHEGENFIMSDSGHFTITESMKPEIDRFGHFTLTESKPKIDRFRHQPYSPPSPPLWVGGPA